MGIFGDKATVGVCGCVRIVMLKHLQKGLLPPTPTSFPSPPLDLVHLQRGGREYDLV